MTKYIMKRLFIALVTTLVILFALFLMLNYMPGTPFNDEKLTPEQKQILMEKNGLDKSVPERFVRYLGLMLKGDFGISYAYQKNMPVSNLLNQRLWISIRLGFCAVIVGLIFGIILGIFAALYHGTIADTLASVISVFGVSVPSYVFAMGLVYWLGFRHKFFPIRFDPRSPGLSSVLPVIALSVFATATIARFLRSEMLEVFGSEYIELARAKGLPEHKVITDHGVRNSLIPVITVLGPLVVNLMTGSLVVEKIFAIPGLGNLLVEAINVNDYNIVIAVSFVYSVLFIFTMLLVDILYGVIDPRIRLAKGGAA